MRARSRRRNLQPRTVASVSFDPEEIQTVDDAAEALEQTRSTFTAQAAVEKARRVLAQRKRTDETESTDLVAGAR